MRTRNNARASYATESFDDKIGGQVSRASGIYFTRECQDGDRALPRSPISRKLLRSSWSRERDIVATRSRRKRRIIYLHPRFPDESVSLHDKILLRFEYTSKCVTAVLLARETYIMSFTLLRRRVFFAEKISMESAICASCMREVESIHDAHSIVVVDHTCWLYRPEDYGVQLHLSFQDSPR